MVGFLYRDATGMNISYFFLRVKRDAPRLTATPEIPRHQRRASYPQKENRGSKPRKRSSMPYFEHDDRGNSSDEGGKPKRSRRS